MKNHIYSFILFLLVWQAHADDSITNIWGPETNQLQMNIRLRGDLNRMQPNSDYSLILRVKNNSTNLLYFSDMGLNTDPSYGVECIVISSSGKNISPKIKSHGIGANILMQCQPHQIEEYEFQLGHICKLDALGTYKIIAKKRFWDPGNPTNRPTVISNPLFVKVVPVK
jgi:hypothetical protein